MKYDFKDRPLCYVAAPYSIDDPVENTHDAVLIGDEIQASGLVTAYIPHLNLLWHLIKPHDVEYWYLYDIAILARSDVLLRMPGESGGADDEVIFAEKKGIPVVYSIEDLVVWALGE